MKRMFGQLHTAVIRVPKKYFLHLPLLSIYKTIPVPRSIFKMGTMDFNLLTDVRKVF